MSYTDNSSPYTVNKLVSVIVPTFNDTSEDLLQTVNSVLLQTHNNLELIVVDDGSVIPFADINFLVDDKRVRFVPLYNNCGVAHARNQGISRARGEYIAFLDTGDWWESRKLEKQLKILSEKDVKWVYTSIVNHTPDGYTTYSYANQEGWVYDKLLIEQIIKGSSSSVMVRKDLLYQTGFFYDLEDIIEDWDMWIRLSQISRVAFVYEPLVHLKRFSNSSRSFQYQKIDRLKNFINRHWDNYVCENLTNFALGWLQKKSGLIHLYNNKPIKGIASWIKLLKYKPLWFPFHLFPIAIISIVYPSCFKKLHYYYLLFKTK